LAGVQSGAHPWLDSATVYVVVFIIVQFANEMSSSRERDGKGMGEWVRFVLLVEFDHGARRRRETVMSRSHESRIKTNGVSSSTDIDNSFSCPIPRGLSTHRNLHCKILIFI
jgi:hypothetical protein